MGSPSRRNLRVERAQQLDLGPAGPPHPVALFGHEVRAETPGASVQRGPGTGGRAREGVLAALGPGGERATPSMVASSGPSASNTTALAFPARGRVGKASA